MTANSQKMASETHRRRAKARGLVRLEVQAPRADIRLIRALAARLRSDTESARALRSTLEQALADEVRTAFDIFGSDLSDEAFEGIFDQPRPTEWREIDL